MVSALASPTVPNSQSWWQASPKSSAQDLRKAAEASEKMPSRSKSSGFKLLASAIGFKSKKPQPTLTIQQPPTKLPRRAHTSHGIVTAPVLSPSNSNSSSRTGFHSIGPETPLDSPKRNSHNSLFTLSDADPFAVHSATSAPPTPSQSSLYSVGSDNAMPEFARVKVVDAYTNDRLSYASNSSNSVHHGNGYLSPIDHVPKSLVSKKSSGSLRISHTEQTMGPPPNGFTRSRAQTLARSTSSTTLKEKNRSSQPDPPVPPRPPMRARGMTDSGPYAPRDLYSPELVESAAVAAFQNSRGLVRNPSLSRVGMPKFAPPAQELPPTPPLPPSARSHERTPEINKPASSSGSIVSSPSSLSPFASPILADQLNGRKHLSSSPSNPSSPDLLTPSKTSQGSLWSSPRTIKKALSQQSLRRNHSSVSSNEPPPPLPDTVITQPLRKQPSFNDPIFPAPPSTIPTLRHTSSFGSQPSSPPKESPMIQEPKRSSSNPLGTFSTPGRRRLFSVSSHRSQTLDDDTRSVASVRSDSNQTLGSVSFRSLGVPLSPISNHSGWEDTRPQSILSTSSAAVQQEYTPQHILSPAEMEKLAAGLGDIGDRSATSSRRSSAQGSSGPGESSPVELTSPITRKPSSSAISVQTARREPSCTTGSPVSPPPPRPTLRQSMSQNTLASLPRASSPLGFASLPPPPRRRPRTRPTFPATTSPDVSADIDSIGFMPLPPAPRRNTRPKISVEKALHRRSIARKPSFLDIDDDTDEEGSHALHDNSIQGSFLDLARESFDSVRSGETETY